jgi:dTDP-4-dehydrorhamnose 3,5-epimerase
VIFTPLELAGAYIVDIEPRRDDRGFFARAWAREEFEEHGLDTRVTHCNLAFNERRGTLRGMHFQRPPHAEVKLVRCTRGAVYDVIIDLRPESPTYCRWIGVELSEENRRMLYIPERFAHGYQTLVDGSETFYQLSVAYAPDYADGVRWDDPAFGIEWPRSDDRLISEKDRRWPDYERVAAEVAR